MLFTDSMKEIKISRETCVPIKTQDSASIELGTEDLDDTSPDNNSSELDEVSAKLMARIKQMKKKQNEDSSKEFQYNKPKDFGFSMNSPIEISPLQTQNLNLETVNENEEILHQKIGGEGGQAKISGLGSDERRYLIETIRKQKKKELNLLNSFKVIPGEINTYRPKSQNLRKCSRKKSLLNLYC